MCNHKGKGLPGTFEQPLSPSAHPGKRELLPAYLPPFALCPHDAALARMLAENVCGTTLSLNHFPVPAWPPDTIPD